MPNGGVVEFDDTFMKTGLPSAFSVSLSSLSIQS